MVLPMLSLNIAWYIEKQAIRMEIREKLFTEPDRSKLKLLKFNVRDAKSFLSWKDKREFEFNGRMYDVVETEMLGDTVAYLCWPDDKETGLNRKLNEMTARAMGSDKQNSNRRLLVDYLKVQFVQNIVEYAGWLAGKDLVPGFFFLDLYSSVYLPPLSPPPKVC